MKNYPGYLTLISFWVLFSMVGRGQEVYFFSEGTDLTYYDQGLVDVSNLEGSSFEFTHPPGLPQYNDKVPCTTIAYQGATSLKFKYTSAPDGNWKVSIHQAGWGTVDLSSMDSLSFYVYTSEELPNTALPMLGLRTLNKNGLDEVSSQLYSPTAYNSSLPAGQWSRVTFPLGVMKEDEENSELDFSETKAVIFNQSETNNSSRLILIDQLAAFKSLEEIPVVTNLELTGYDSHAELRWEVPEGDFAYRVYASFDGGDSWEVRAETYDHFYLDFVPVSARNTAILYRVVTLFQGMESVPLQQTAVLRNFTDEELLDMVQRYAFRYFWDGAHPETGMALERSDGNGRTAASGATGMGLMAMVVAHERQYRPREEIKARVLQILAFLDSCDRHHGAWSHWYNANTGETQPFSLDDDGGDIVETSYVAQGLIALKNYFSGMDALSVQIREEADQLWRAIDWNWYRNGDQNVLYWHWSPNIGFQKNMKVTGWNETLITYLMAAASPTYGIPKEVYEEGYAGNGSIVNKRTFYNYEINLSPDWGGPLFWIHYTHLGIDPHDLQDQYASYWQENVNTALIHYAYAVDNPLNHQNYGQLCWGLTASDDPDGYTAHQPMSNDNGTISPTAALASMPYTPEESLRALKYFYRERGAELFGLYGPYDAFNDNLNWVKKAYIGIDQGPIVVMIENYRTGLLWNAVMKDANVKEGLEKLGFQYNVNVIVDKAIEFSALTIYPNPSKDWVVVSHPQINSGHSVILKVYSLDGRLMWRENIGSRRGEFTFDGSFLKNGLYFIMVENGDRYFYGELLVKK